MDKDFDATLAAEVMDKLKPDWWQQIDPIKLDLMSSRDCICGQNGIDWNIAAAIYDTAGGEGCAFANNLFVHSWLEQIALRMPDSVLYEAPDRQVVHA